MIDRKAPGKAPTLAAEQRAALARVVAAGPEPWRDGGWCAGDGSTWCSGSAAWAHTFAQGVSLDAATLAGDEVIETPAGSVELEDSYFGDDASRRLDDEMDLQRGSQACIWATGLSPVSPDTQAVAV